MLSWPHWHKSQFTAWTTYTNGHLIGADSLMTKDYLSILVQFANLSCSNSTDQETQNRWVVALYNFIWAYKLQDTFDWSSSTYCCFELWSSVQWHRSFWFSGLYNTATSDGYPVRDSNRNIGCPVSPIFLRRKHFLTGFKSCCSERCTCLPILGRVQNAASYRTTSSLHSRPCWWRQWAIFVWCFERLSTCPFLSVGAYEWCSAWIHYAVLLR